jgi:hypothetical protein
VVLHKIKAVNTNLEWAEDFNWDALARGCDVQLDFSEALINVGLLANVINLGRKISVEAAAPN